MGEDVDMDAPQISTLREEDSPPPVRTSKFRVKLLVNENKGASSPSKQTAGESDEEEEEDEEDQLIDDDDDVKPIPPSASQGSVYSTRSPAKRKQAPKRPRKEKSTGTKGKSKSSEENVFDRHMGAPVAGSAMTWVEQTRAGNELLLPMPQMHEWDTASVGSNTASTATSAKKKPGPKKGTGGRGRGRGITKTASARSNPIPHIPHVDDGETLSEIYPGTAPSSPGPQEDELESLSVSGIVPQLEEFGLENVPLPLYPLPSKPFPVQPPVKIGTGFAPGLPLEKTGKKVRHWRQAQREIRGIAGGRWFVRSWVGEKDSELSAAHAEKTAPPHLAPEAATLALPKLASLALQGHSASGKITPKGKNMAVPLSTAASSRSASAVPDMHVPREPSKMRTSVAALSREGSPSEVAEVVEMVPS